MSQINVWFPNKPPINVPAGDDVFKKWFKSVYRFAFGEAHMPIAQTVALTCAEEWFYPVDCTAGAITITLPAANSYSYKKYVVKKVDSSANAITVAVTGTDTIEGAATSTISAQYGYIEYVSDGISKWYIVAQSGGGAVSLKSQVFTASGTFTWPTNSDGSTVEVVTVTLQGSGSGGGRGANSSAVARGGGASGELIYKVPYYRNGVTTTTVTINAAGLGATATSTNGLVGGTAVFGSLIAAGGKAPATGTGGQGGGNLGGAGGTAASPGNTGNRPSSLDIAQRGGSGGGGGGNAAAANGGAGGDAQQNSGGAGGTSDVNNGGGGGGGASFFGNGCKGGNAPGVAGTAPGATDYGVGGGAGGGNTGGNQGNGSNGGPGLCIVEFMTF